MNTFYSIVAQINSETELIDKTIHYLKSKFNKNINYLYKSKNNLYYSKNDSLIDQYTQLGITNKFLNDLVNTTLSSSFLIIPLLYGVILIDGISKISDEDLEKLDNLKDLISIKQKSIRDSNASQSIIKTQQYVKDLINHDIKTPLTTISGYIYFLQKDSSKKDLINNLNVEKNKIIDILERSKKVDIIDSLYSCYNPTLVKIKEFNSFYNIYDKSVASLKKVLIDPVKIVNIINILVSDQVPTYKVEVDDRNLYLNFRVTDIENYPILNQYLTKSNKEWVYIINDLAKINNFKIVIDEVELTFQLKFPIYSFI